MFGVEFPHLYYVTNVKKWEDILFFRNIVGVYFKPTIKENETQTNRQHKFVPSFVKKKDLRQK